MPQDPKRAAYWWHRAASEGPSAEAMNHLGDLYFSGVGHPLSHILSLPVRVCVCVHVFAFLFACLCLCFCLFSVCVCSSVCVFV